MKKSIQEEVSRNWPESFADFDFQVKGRPAKLSRDTDKKPQPKKPTKK